MRDSAVHGAPPLAVGCTATEDEYMYASPVADSGRRAAGPRALLYDQNEPATPLKRPAQEMKPYLDVSSKGFLFRAPVSAGQV